MLAQRAASEGPRWTRAVEAQSAPIPEKELASLEGLFLMDDGRPMRAMKASLAIPCSYQHLFQPQIEYR